MEPEPPQYRALESLFRKGDFSALVKVWPQCPSLNSTISGDINHTTPEYSESQTRSDDGSTCDTRKVGTRHTAAHVLPDTLCVPEVKCVESVNSKVSLTQTPAMDQTSSPSRNCPELGTRQDQARHIAAPVPDTKSVPEVPGGAMCCKQVPPTTAARTFLALGNHPSKTRTTLPNKYIAQGAPEIISGQVSLVECQVGTSSTEALVPRNKKQYYFSHASPTQRVVRASRLGVPGRSSTSM